MSLAHARTTSIRIVAFIFLIMVSCFAFAYQVELKSVIRTALESKWLMAGSSIYIASCTAMYQIFVGGNSEFRGGLLAHFGKYADAIFALVAFIPASTTSLALIKGLFMQYFFAQVHFVEFDDIDMIAMLIVSSFLLYYSLFNATKMLIAAITQVDSAKISVIDDTK